MPSSSSAPSKLRSVVPAYSGAAHGEGKVVPKQCNMGYSKEGLTAEGWWNQKTIPGLLEGVEYLEVNHSSGSLASYCALGCRS